MVAAASSFTPPGMPPPPPSAVLATAAAMVKHEDIITAFDARAQPVFAGRNGGHHVLRQGAREKAAFIAIAGQKSGDQAREIIRAGP